MPYPFRLLPVIFLLAACGPARHIVQKPIVFDQEREALSLEYMAEHYGLDRDAPTIEPRMIVLHYTVIPTLEKTFLAFDPAVLPAARDGIRSAGALNVSSQFVVDRDGTIYQLMPETMMARHVIGLNHCAIGVENVGGTPELPLTEAQVKANIALVRYLAEKYPIDYLIGHSEYTRFEGHPLWLEKDAGYRTQKSDPGDDFMRQVREKVEDLHFKPLPQPQTR